MRETKKKIVSFCSLRSKIDKLCVKGWKKKEVHDNLSFYPLEFKRGNSTKKFSIVLFKSCKTDHKIDRSLLAEFDNQ